MKTPFLIVLPLLAAFAAAPVLAKDKHGDNGNGNGRGNSGQARGHDGRDTAHADGRHDNGRHLGWYKQEWRRGDRVDVVHIEPAYYVDDYARYELRQPPEGHRWVRPVDGRYILIEVTTGLIIDALGY